MPCSICRKNGHNKKTCPDLQIDLQPDNLIDPVEDLDPHPVNDPLPVHDPLPVNDHLPLLDPVEDQMITLTLYELEVRNLVRQNMLNQKTDEEIQFISSFLNIEKKEFQIINYDSYKPLNLYISNANKKLFPFEDNEMDYTFMGQAPPKSIHKLVTFTGYTYMIKYVGLGNVFINVTQSMKDNYVIDFKASGMILGLNETNKTFISLLKMDYLIKQMIRLGGLEDDNFGSILDLHQDIDVPQCTNLDLEVAGIPNELTNIT